MRPFLILWTAMLCSLPSFGQEKLMMYPSFGGAHFEYEKDTAVYQVTPRQVAQILFDTPASYKEFKKARTNNTIAGIMGFLGAGLIIIPSATAVIGGDPEWALAAGGAALIAGSIPLSISYRRKAQHAFDMFNEKHAALRTRTRFYVTGSRAGLVIQF